MEWKSATKNADGAYSIPVRWLHLHYYEALNILFRFENSLRVFVYAILKNERLDEWDHCNLAAIDGSNEQPSIKKAAASRVAQAASFGYLGYGVQTSMLHLTSGELVELITANAYWGFFASYFKGNKDVIKYKLLEIGNIRNALAHFRPIKPDDVEVVKQNSRHTLLGVEDCLKALYNQPLRVPTNTSDAWYKSLATLGTDQVTTVPLFSENKTWLNVRLMFNSPMLVKQQSSSHWYFYQHVKLNPADILVHYPEIRKYVTYCSESVQYPSLTQTMDMSVVKSVNLVFRLDVFAKNHGAIAGALKELLQKISEECELLNKDALARGVLTEPVHTNSYWQQKEGEATGRWVFTYSSLSQAYHPDHPTEYWGGALWAIDEVSSIQRYPWMPEDISGADWGFE